MSFLYKSGIVSGILCKHLLCSLIRMETSVLANKYTMYLCGYRASHCLATPKSIFKQHAPTVRHVDHFQRLVFSLKNATSLHPSICYLWVNVCKGNYQVKMCALLKPERPIVKLPPSLDILYNLPSPRTFFREISLSPHPFQYRMLLFSFFKLFSLFIDPIGESGIFTFTFL